MGHSWTIVKCTQNYGEVYAAPGGSGQSPLRGSRGMRPMDLISRFEDKEVFQSPHYTDMW